MLNIDYSPLLLLLASDFVTSNSTSLSSTAADAECVGWSFTMPWDDSAIEQCGTGIWLKFMNNWFSDNFYFINDRILGQGW